MGDRGNIAIVQEDGRTLIYLYAHWTGSKNAATLQAALRRGARWTDAPYLTRIIFCEMVKGAVESDTGFGIATSPCDNEHALLVVDPRKQTIHVADIDAPHKAKRTKTFGVFVELSAKALQKFYEPEG